MSMTSAEIRSSFLQFFAARGHEIVPSSSLIPSNDATLLFTNAGMVPFKDVFLGTEQRPYQRATSSQRCVRAGGKHNDLENVGYTARHHTFFEMLGNFSFGDYFKREAIQYAWQFLTEELKIPQEKLWVTVFEEDDEAYDIWAQEIGVPEDRISRIGAKDNFWQMGDTGPCGPCSEIFYDHGDEVWGGPPGTPEEDGDRYIEIWNLVFMQYNRDSQGVMHPLPKPSVDTGMGLERIAAVMQQVHSNYEIDTFVALIKQVAALTNCQDLSQQSLRVIADHIRSCSFLIADGVLPSNEGRGYVLRRIIRRAVRHGHKLGAEATFFYRLVPELVRLMGTAFPELVAAEQNIMKALKQEEEQFSRTVQRGLALLADELTGLQQGDTLSGDVAFKLYDTYGFPLDLTADITREQGIHVDQVGFDAAMAEQRQRAQQASQFGLDYNAAITAATQSHFIGYEQVSGESEIVELFVDGKAVTEVAAGVAATLVLKETPFYAESGGQVGDQGQLLLKKEVAFTVQDTRFLGQAIGHIGCALVALKIGDSVQAEVNYKRRDAIRRNHSATHLIHAALRAVLGEHVQQKGSLVNEERLRFDFSHPQAVSAQELKQLEREVNRVILSNAALDTELMPIEQAKAAGALALFGEKYDDEVRVVRMGDFSVELCGGTHVQRLGDIGLFRIVSEAGIAAGVRRIEAVTGMAALDYSQTEHHHLQTLATLVKTDVAMVTERLKQLLEQQRLLERENSELQRQLATSASAELAQNPMLIHGVKVVIAEIPGADSKVLRDLLDDLKVRLGEGVILLAVRDDEKVSFIAGVTKGLTGRVKAGDLVNKAAALVGGKGGGRPEMAQAGGNQPQQLEQALATTQAWLNEVLN